MLELARRIVMSQMFSNTCYRIMNLSVTRKLALICKRQWPTFLLRLMVLILTVFLDWVILFSIAWQVSRVNTTGLMFGVVLFFILLIANLFSLGILQQSYTEQEKDNGNLGRNM